ncbi:hypothetical protein SLEP1_g11662 [Rubroshorea leprosula]|nr:hypothetical protein SLEP1_g11662 [Rubroshorea leprosula]
METGLSMTSRIEVLVRIGLQSVMLVAIWLHHALKVLTMGRASLLIAEVFVGGT